MSACGCCGHGGWRAKVRSKRDASLVTLGDCVIEPPAPAFTVEGWDVMPAAELAAIYRERWEAESSYRQIKTFQRGP